jgi:hypothetical protein
MYINLSINNHSKQQTASNNSEVSNAEKIPLKETTAPEQYLLNTRFIKDKEFLIDNKAILTLKYEDIIKIWGSPNEIIQVKVYFPATTEASYSYILRYDSISIEMYPAQKDTPIESTESFRFDITGNKYDFYGVRIGMSLEEYLKRVENKVVFSVSEILNDSEGEKFPYVYKKLLVSVKPPHYYESYDKAVYEQIVINDIPYGIVVLFNNDKIERIVYGYPNAS